MSSCMGGCTQQARKRTALWALLHPALQRVCSMGRAWHVRITTTWTFSWQSSNLKFSDLSSI